MVFISIDSSYFSPFAVVSIIVIAMSSLSSDCYDPLDPNGNIEVTFDTFQWEDDGYSAKVTIQNYYQYRHIDKPGWKLGWTWAENEVIWSMQGAFATKQGNCSSFRSDIHSCVKDPQILDLMPDSSPESISVDCCRGGLLDAWAINPPNSFSSFQIKVGNLKQNPYGTAPLNLTLMAPGLGYTCGPLLDVDPTVSLDNGGRRQVQVFRTWKATCTYSSFLAAKTPVCCVSLSTFYNPTITSCPLCSCGCRLADKTTETCIRTSFPSMTDDVQSDPDLVKCTDHMCPIRVHWHIMTNYVDHWRVKLTITNYNYHKSFSDWNVLVQHPGFSQKTTPYSFNSTTLPAGFRDEVALFWGIPYVNTELVSTKEDQVGSVSTEILLKKDMNSFTFSNGWAFPRRLYFNGESCQMPLPDSFPTLPNGAVSIFAKPSHCLLLLLIFLTSKALLAPWL